MAAIIVSRLPSNAICLTTGVPGKGWTASQYRPLGITVGRAIAHLNFSCCAKRGCACVPRAGPHNSAGNDQVRLQHERRPRAASSQCKLCH